ncbi:hypothetical protein [Citrobacter freundii]|uniref:hypothetical protein n=1 Tax=Citrobacter freundii TaxID=546 RepID=UPI0021C68E49|nr:hypothetical protein [Citrobacter freundii]MCU0184874.1 hypothetical protein [Citrobacter freundii]
MTSRKSEPQYGEPDLTGIRFFIEGQLACTMPPGSIVDNIFRLPVMAGSKWQAEVYGYAQVDRITLAQSVRELPA